MADFSATYTATKRLTAGHLINTQQTFEIDLRQLDPIDSFNATQTFTPNDAETEMVSSTEEYIVETKLMDKATMLLCREFLNSCSASELFTVILEGGASRNAHLFLKRSLSPSNPSPLKYRYKFKIRVY
ncbi:MAG: hypothetical protein COA86_02745 [Kangiella sp.]|nr:MAG: hypothetical protein COA86_02745 [Kangiella sp.]